MNNYPNVLKETANGISQVCITDELLEQRKVFLNQQVDTDTMTSLIQQFMYLSILKSRFFLIFLFLHIICTNDPAQMPGAVPAWCG